MKDSTCLVRWLGILLLPVFMWGCINMGDPSPTELGSITGRVFFDANADEQCEECECGLAEVRINLFTGTCRGTAHQTAKTDTEGYYAFQDLEAGDYCIFVDLPPTCDGYLPTTSISQQVVLHAGEAMELDSFGFDSYVDTNE